MKQVACMIVMSFLCTLGFADPVPPLPELEAVLESGQIVTRDDLKARGAEVEQRFMFKSYQDRLGLSEEEVRERFPDIVMFVGYLGGGQFDADLYEDFKARQTLTHEDLYVRHNALFHAEKAKPDDPEIHRLMRENILEMERQGYSPIRVCGAASDYRTSYENEDDSMEDDQFLIERVAKMFATIELDSHARTYIFEKFVKSYIDTKDEDLRGAVIREFETRDGIDPWVIEMIHGINQRRVAWIARGDAYAYKTSDERFAKFHHHLDQAMIHLKRAYELDPTCPQTSSQLVEVTYPRSSVWMDEGWIWVGRTMIACLDYEELYDNMRHILQFKWQGDLTSRAEFAQWLARPEFVGTGVDIEALYMLERGWWDHGVVFGSADWFWEEEKPAIEAVMKALELRIERGETFGNDYEESIMAYFEFRHNRDMEKSAEYIRACKNGINRNARRKMRFDDLNLASIVLPLSMPETKKAAESALGLEASGDFDQAAETWSEIQRTLNDLDDSIAVEAVRNRVQMCEWQGAYDKRTDWVELKFDEHMSGWDPVNGTWERVNDSTVRVVEKGLDNETLLVADISTEYWFELRMRARIVSDNTKPPTFGIGYSRGHRLTDEWDQMRYLSVRLHSDLTGIGWHYAGNDYKAPLPEAGEDGWYEYRLLVKGDQVEGYINDQLVGKGEHPNWKPEKEPELIKVALAAFNSGDETIEFSDIRIRKRRPPMDLEF